MASSSQKMSFTIRRPSPPSRGLSPATPAEGAPNFKVPAIPRHLAALGDSTPLGSPLSRSAASSPKPYPPSRGRSYDSSDEEDKELQDQLVTGFDRFGVERADGRRKVKEQPLVITALKNKDWRAIARKRRGHFVPESGKVGTGADGSVGGLGTRDSINSGPVLSGLQIRKREESVTVEADDGDVVMEEDIKVEGIKVEEVEETEEQRALRALLAEANGETQQGPVIHAIPTPVSEADALKQDVDELPEAATWDDYERVPVSQFGAAMLRGMGWKEGTAATRKPGKGLVQPYLPPSRPALLGIGAKEQEVLDDGNKRKHRKPTAKYVPIVKMERGDSSASRDRNRSRSPVRSSAPSRRSSRSPSRRDREKASRDDSSRRRDRDSDRSRDHERSTRERDRDGGRDRERDYRRDYDKDKDRRDPDSRGGSYRRSESGRDTKRRDY
ncbi:DExH-box splicing factor binding site-domain-containing protein [Ephemerocybe angulata]|uniref:DExH-box splicing factor binding site-domain-containing protein n=1 Tax=Ephemerocybe angulata TaxID=980116 RepID=A0A8H6I922_9AGAR|nr:DExH-box splicing factor binding site-domain-containing protein [Tulosesus angulatus]